jgi:ribosome maturation factor RimP
MKATGTDRIDDAVRPVVEPILASLDLELYDLQTSPQLVRILVDGPDGVSSDDLATATRIISRRLDEHDPMPGTYTLEISSPGIERPLRTPKHFRGAVGESVTIKCGPGVEGDRRVNGTLIAADDDGVTVALDDPEGAERTLRHLDIAKARTAFAWDSTGSATRKASRS